MLILRVLGLLVQWVVISLASAVFSAVWGMFFTQLALIPAVLIATTSILQSIRPARSWLVAVAVDAGVVATIVALMLLFNASYAFHWSGGGYDIVGESVDPPWQKFARGMQWVAIWFLGQAALIVAVDQSLRYARAVLIERTQ